MLDSGCGLDIHHVQRIQRGAGKIGDSHRVEHDDFVTHFATSASRDRGVLAFGVNDNDRPIVLEQGGDDTSHPFAGAGRGQGHEMPFPRKLNRVDVAGFGGFFGITEIETDGSPWVFEFHGPADQQSRAIKCFRQLEG